MRQRSARRSAARLAGNGAVIDGIAPTPLGAVAKRFVNVETVEGELELEPEQNRDDQRVDHQRLDQRQTEDHRREELRLSTGIARDAL